MNLAAPETASAPTGPDAAEKRPRSAWRAALLTFITTGLGQLYNGQPRQALFFFLAMTSISVLSYLMDWFASAIALLVVLVVSLALELVAVVHAATVAWKRQDYVLQPYNRWYVYVGLIIASSLLSWGLQSALFTYDTFTIPSNSMQPTLQVGDYLMAKTDAYRGHDPERGDVVVFRLPEDPHKIFVKRVIGLPGERVAVKQYRVYINGQAIADPWANLKLKAVAKGVQEAPADFGPVVVPRRAYFVLGDNRRYSYDSRLWLGDPFVPRQAIIGKAMYILWSRDRGRVGQGMDPQPGPKPDQP